MKPVLNCTLPTERFQSFLTASVRADLIEEASTGAYVRKLDPFVFIKVLLLSYLHMAASVRDILDRWSEQLGTTSTGTLSYALGSAFHRNLAFAMLTRLGGPEPGNGDLVVLDSMAISIPRTRRHNCAKMNDKTVGGGVLWSINLSAKRNSVPIRVLRLLRGSWLDGHQMRSIELARGPIHIMDRGFYVIDLIHKWIGQGVRFVVRAKGKELVYEPVQRLGKRRCLQARASSRRPRTVKVLYDGTARIGSVGRRGERPVARLVVCQLKSVTSGRQEDLVLVSSEMNADAQRLLDLYGRRWEIEGFHRLLKRTIGLAHLYSFRQTGIELLIAVPTLLAVLLWLEETDNRKQSTRLKQDILKTIRDALAILRLEIGKAYIWKPNMVGKHCRKPKWKNH